MTNLYCHFPFCRRKCAYCALHSRAGVSKPARDAYAARLVGEIRERVTGPVTTVYFGGGTPAMCDLSPVFAALTEKGFAPGYEFTVELNPADVIDDPKLPERLVMGGVNRVSMGFEALDDATLQLLGRSHSLAEAIAAFKAVKAVIPNCGFDLIVGLPSPDACSKPYDGRARTPVAPLQRILGELQPAHVSVYSLIREPGTLLDKRARCGELILPNDDAALDEVAAFAATLAEAGLTRYEISNYAPPGRECRHNLAVWKGEDYLGLGEGAHGREGFIRTVGEGTPHTYSREELSPEADALEREVFSLRTWLGFDPEAAIKRHPVLAGHLEAWRRELNFNANRGLLCRRANAYFLTSRGAEVVDSIIGNLVL